MPLYCVTEYGPLCNSDSVMETTTYPLKVGALGKVRRINEKMTEEGWVKTSEDFGFMESKTIDNIFDGIGTWTERVYESPDRKQKTTVIMVCEFSGS